MGTVKLTAIREQLIREGVRNGAGIRAIANVSGLSKKDVLVYCRQHLGVLAAEKQRE